jgi:hypothetical protein
MEGLSYWGGIGKSIIPKGEKTPASPQKQQKNHYV